LGIVHSLPSETIKGKAELTPLPSHTHRKRWLAEVSEEQETTKGRISWLDTRSEPTKVKFIIQAKPQKKLNKKGHFK
jgi:hypothetical protein